MLLSYSCIVASAMSLILCSLALFISVNVAYCQEDKCPLWHHYSSTNKKCECCSGPDFKGVIQCSKDYLNVAVSHCMTWNSITRDVELSRCFFQFKYTEPYECIFKRILSNISGTDLNNVTCRMYNRQGLQCRQCMDGYGPSAFSDGATCADCSANKYLLILNLFFQLGMVTMMYLVVILLRVKGTASPFSIIITYCQFGINTIAISTGFYSHVTCHVGQKYAIAILTLLGMFNLDFFRFVLPPLCIGPSLKTIDTILFDYIIALYPIVLTCFIYVVLTLYDRNYRLVVCLSLPFRVFRRRVWNPKETILNTCATFLLLSYSKFLFVSISLILGVRTYDCNGELSLNSTILLHDPTIQFLHSEHIPYFVLAFSVLVVFILIPPFLLLAYPTRLFKKCLEWCRFKRWDILAVTMDIFQGWYKDGTCGTRDYRFLSSLHMVIRIWLGCSLSVLLISNDYNMNHRILIATAIVHIFIGIVYLAEKPYKILWMNVVDGVILILLGVLFLAILMGDKTLFYVGSISAVFVLVVVVLFVVSKCVKKLT